MSLVPYLYFVPLGIGIAWLFYLMFRADLATQPLGKIISYFVGVIIIILAVGWLIDNFLPSWFNDRLENTQRSTEWQNFINTSTGLVQSSLNEDDANIVVPPAATVIIVTPIPSGGSGPQAGDEAPTTPGAVGFPTQHTIRPGDTLAGIARQYGTTVDDIMIANGLTSHIIYPGDVLIIPAPSSGK